ncbi:hypothetical protein LDP08_20970, partial [Ralstonia pseudosolanacearum]|uniref:hypothetical protein n=1 Tax=Ralstonia pseudosolanacearum TaxID=1310165 RepID=UPI003CF3716E
MLVNTWFSVLHRPSPSISSDPLRIAPRRPRESEVRQRNTWLFRQCRRPLTRALHAVRSDPLWTVVKNGTSV